MMTTYLHNTGEQAFAWWKASLCVHCGSTPVSGSCRCRYCDSCSKYWLADTLADGDDGKPAKELCAECRESA